MYIYAVMVEQWLTCIGVPPPLGGLGLMSSSGGIWASYWKFYQLLMWCFTCATIIQ